MLGDDGARRSERRPVPGNDGARWSLRQPVLRGDRAWRSSRWDGGTWPTQEDGVGRMQPAHAGATRWGGRPAAATGAEAKQQPARGVEPEQAAGSAREQAALARKKEARRRRDKEEREGRKNKKKRKSLFFVFYFHITSNLNSCIHKIQ